MFIVKFTYIQVFLVDYYTFSMFAGDLFVAVGTNFSINRFTPLEGPKEGKIQHSTKNGIMDLVVPHCEIVASIPNDMAEQGAAHRWIVLLIL